SCCLLAQKSLRRAKKWRSSSTARLRRNAVGQTVGFCRLPGDPLFGSPAKRQQPRFSRRADSKTICPTVPKSSQRAKKRRFSSTGLQPVFSESGDLRTF